MKEYVWCTPEIIRELHQSRGNLQFIFLKLREVLDNMVLIIIHTADHKPDDDSHKCMTSALGDKLRKMSRMFQYNSKIILSFFRLHRLQSFKLCIIICCLFWLDVILCPWNAETSTESIAKVSRHSDSLLEKILFNSNRKTRAVRRDKRVDNLNYIYQAFLNLYLFDVSMAERRGWVKVAQRSRKFSHRSMTIEALSQTCFDAFFF